MLKFNIHKYIDFIKNFDEKNIKLNKNILKSLIKNLEFKNFLLSDVRFCFYFCNWVIGGRCEILEDVFTSDSCYALNYAAFVLKGKLPDKIHNYMLTRCLSDKDDCAKQYFVWLLNREDSSFGVWGDYK